jgi:hypothetical protein
LASSSHTSILCATKPPSRARHSLATTFTASDARRPPQSHRAARQSGGGSTCRNGGIRAPVVCTSRHSLTVACAPRSRPQRRGRRWQSPRPYGSTCDTSPLGHGLANTTHTHTHTHTLIHTHTTHTTHDTRHTTHDTRHKTHDTQQTTHNTRHTTHDTLHPTHNTRHTHTHTEHSGSCRGTLPRCCSNCSAAHLRVERAPLLSIVY